MSELKTLHRIGSVKDYHDQFDSVLTRVSLPEEYLVSYFVTGLRHDTQMHVRIF